MSRESLPYSCRGEKLLSVLVRLCLRCSILHTRNCLSLVLSLMFVLGWLRMKLSLMRLGSVSNHLKFVIRNRSIPDVETVLVVEDRTLLLLLLLLESVEEED
jgi:hypothetical protein